jgi:lactoylglutathione lyase
VAQRKIARRPARQRSSAKRRIASTRAPRAARRAAASRKVAARRAPKRTARPPRAAKRSAPARATRAVTPAAARGAIGLVVQHMDYTTHDLAAVERFYREVLGFASNRDPQFDYLHVETGPSSSLGFMAPMPGPPEQWRPPREPAIYLIVEDVDRAHRALVEKGVTFEQEPTDMPWGHRTAVLRDPEGRLLCLAQPIAVSVAP